MPSLKIGILLIFPSNSESCSIYIASIDMQGKIMENRIINKI